MTQKLLKPAAFAVAGFSALIGYAHLETKWFTLRHVSVPVLAPGQPDVRILQLADLHLVENQHTKLAWLACLADLNPDLVVDTGDNISSAAAIPALLAVLAQPGPDGGRPLLEVPGVFVGGSNDYFAPKPKNALRYLLGPSKYKSATLPKLPWRELFDAFAASGWVNLNNRRAEVVLDDGRMLSFVGTNDAHIGLDKFPALPAGAVPSAGSRGAAESSSRSPAPLQPIAHMGVTHAPYKRVLLEFDRDAVALVIAGHTHGGQLCIPGFGALVTNCDLERKYASGLHRWRDIWLYVSAGAGTSPYAPFRFACRPSATLLTLTAASDH